VGQSPTIGAAIRKTKAKPEKAAKPTKKKKSKPPKQYDRSAWLKQWNQAMGPLVRLASKIADGVNEKGCESYKLVQNDLNAATEKMEEWMGK
jgi:hypothetical protein